LQEGEAVEEEEVVVEAVEVGAECA